MFDDWGSTERWRSATLFFEAEQYAEAARILAPLVEEEPQCVAPRLLLARAYYHSAQLQRAEEELRGVIDRDPVDGYAHLMLGRTLQRLGRRAEADKWLRLASALGAPELSAP
jgi:Flp pilus assembly protein TadD